MAPATAQCVHNLRIEIDRQDLYIMPGVVNCISCNIMGDIAWQIEVDGDLTTSTSSIAVRFVSTMNNYQCLRTMLNQEHREGKIFSVVLLLAHLLWKQGWPLQVRSISKVVTDCGLKMKKKLHCQSKFKGKYIVHTNI